MTTGAFHGQRSIKATYLTRARAAERDGRIIQRAYFRPDERSGCAVGILVYGDDHAALAAALNIPRDLVDCLPTLHDALPAAEARSFPRRVIAAIPVGADLSLVAPRFSHALLMHPRHGVWQLADAQGKAAIEAMAALYARQIAGEMPSPSEWKTARRAAAEAARAAWEAWAASAASAAKAAWAASAASAAKAAWAASAASAASAAETFVALLAAAPVVGAPASVAASERDLVTV